MLRRWSLLVSEPMIVRNDGMRSLLLVPGVVGSRRLRGVAARRLAGWVKFQQGGEAGRRDAVRRLLALEEMVGAYQVL